MRAAILLATLALLLAPTLASAHIEQFTQAKPLTIGPYSAIVQPRPEPMFANSALSMTAIFSNVETGQFVGSVDSKLVLLSPSGAKRETKLEPDGTGYMVGSVVVQESGNYTFDIVVRDASGEHSNGTSFTVYPDLPVRFRSQDPGQSDPTAGEPFTVSIATVDRVTLVPTDAFSDLTLRLEHWTLDHSRILGEEDLPMTHAGRGIWHADHVFPVSGMYHLRFASESGGFKPDDVPILHVNALDPPAGAKTTPAISVLALACGAFGAALLLRRR